MKLSLTTLILGALLTNGAMAETTVQGVIQGAKTKVFDAFDKESVTVDFATGSAEVTVAEQKDLTALIAAAKSDGKIQAVVVASWSDAEYPATKGESLPQAAKDLAAARNANLTRVIKTLGVTTIQSYAMTEQPSWIAKTFNTQDAKVKGEGEIKDAEDHLAAEIGKSLRDKGGPGKAVVLVRREGDFAAH